MPDLLFKSFRPKVTREVVPELKLASEVPNDCKTYVFYVPGMIDYQTLKDALQKYGGAAGKNIFVGLWRLDAEPYQEILRYFNIRKGPAVVISGKSIFSTDEQQPPQTAFARIDNPKLLNDLPKVSECITETCNLFIEGKIKEALSNARKDQFNASLGQYLRKINEKVSNFLKDRSITFDVSKGQIILSPTAASKAVS